MLFGLKLNKVPVVSEHLDEPDILEFGKSKLKLLHIPGHSPGSLVYYSKDDDFVIAGDVLFFGSIGRTDLPGGDYEALITGIKTKLLSLPKETKVFSGHGQHTSVGHEYDTNPFLV
jgi:glyoxylase-like metal-dependent hydrolase (beta-lactamase superfamily II)